MLFPEDPVFQHGSGAKLPALCWLEFIYLPAAAICLGNEEPRVEGAARWEQCLERELQGWQGCSCSSGCVTCVPCRVTVGSTPGFSSSTASAALTPVVITGDRIVQDLCCHYWKLLDMRVKKDLFSEARHNQTWK